MRRQESELEKWAVRHVEKLGGIAIKLNPMWYKGIPDRLFVLPDSRIVFVEFKDPNGLGETSRAQLWWANRLARLHCNHEIVDSKTAMLSLIAG